MREGMIETTLAEGTSYVIAMTGAFVTSLAPAGRFNLEKPRDGLRRGFGTSQQGAEGVQL
jgi:hypothetical protein